MCGFAGFLSTNCRILDNAGKIVTDMANTILHRGPDDSGVWIDVGAGVALAHRRLSILDLSPAGHQPMISGNGRFVIAFNGEIYNNLDLRRELESCPHPNPSPNGDGVLLTPKPPGDTTSKPTEFESEGVSVYPANGRERFEWRGHSDTETLLAGFETWGVEATLKKTVGMFAIALWDLHSHTLYLGRDRFGEKPLYYGWAGSGSNSAFVFGSELKALRAYPGFANSVSRDALALYMRFAYVPAPHSIYQGIFKLQPGCLLSVTGAVPTAPTGLLCAPTVHGGLELRRWWSLADVVVTGSQNQITDETEGVRLLEQRLKEAVRLQSLADVPLGAFLSGGVDSSAIVSLMQQQSTRPVKTFTVGFEDASFDESSHARAVAQHLGTEHTELFVSVTEAQAVIPHLPTMYDEPFADSSQIPTHLVCKAARQKVTVALSGDAGDELFGGYNRYFWGPRIWNRVAWLPYPARQALGAAIRGVPLAFWNALSHPVNALLPAGQGISRAGNKAHKLASSLTGVRDMDDLYLSLVSVWQDPAIVVKGAVGLNDSLLTGTLPAQGTERHQSRMMFRDSTSYLPDDILCKVDRAAMATSLETRVPFLDHRVAELAWQLPLNMKIRGSEGKWALRQVLYKHVPRELIERPKSGFSVPIGHWLRVPLRDWVENLLDENRLEFEGYFHPSPIRTMWAEHLSGQRDHTASLWTVLMFQSWLEDAA